MVRKSSLSREVEPVKAVVTEMSPGNVEATLETKAEGRAEMLVRYCGPLADRPRLSVRFGERREGRDRVETRDVPMVGAQGEATAIITCGPGAPLEGACFAFFEQTDAAEGECRWDNAGRSLGYYAFDAQTGKVESR
ncbi:MAG: hypothetical protein HY901_07075 [Deltaproteobacteria bacterium]|nr:hypothetical protein [Deltaproteobacteria bacterium]